MFILNIISNHLLIFWLLIILSIKLLTAYCGFCLQSRRKTKRKTTPLWIYLNRWIRRPSFSSLSSGLLAGSSRCFASLLAKRRRAATLLLLLLLLLEELLRACCCFSPYSALQCSALLEPASQQEKKRSIGQAKKAWIFLNL